jgi:hypothetical protein
MGAHLSQWSIPMHGFDVIDGGGATFGPAEMKVITIAYDEAWSEIVGHYDRKTLTRERAQNKLAIAILQAAAINANDVGYLKRAGQRALSYRV